MSVIKFGIGKKFDDYPLGTLQWGSFWKFGEPLQFYILNSLLRYLPKFVVRNKLCKDILTMVAKELLKWQQALGQLPAYRTTGKAGLKYLNSDLQIFVAPQIDPGKIPELIKENLNIHKARGTASGIPQDIRRCAGDDGAYVAYSGPSECGWWADITFPEHNKFGKFSYDSNVFLELPNMLDIVLRNRSAYSDEELKKIFRTEFIPVTTNTRYLFLSSHIIKWGEPLSITDPTPIKYGTFKFGETVYE